jgi:hypothetical protein
MAGERYAKITIQAQLSHDDRQRGDETTRLDFTLGSTTITLYRGGNGGQFSVPDPSDGAGEKYVLQTVQNVLAGLQGQIYLRNLPFVVSAPREVGTMPDYPGAPAPIPLVQFDITATSYGSGSERNLDFRFPNFAGYQPNWAIVENLYNISPVFATARVVDAGIYGSATGSIDIDATGGDSGFYLYTWADGVNGSHREKLRSGKYTVTVRDGSGGASVTLVVTVKQDPKLVVQVTNTSNSITLLVSGGVVPYAIVWADGPMGAVRTGLSEGTYHYLVTDDHGAQVEGEVTLTSNNRYWFSGNPITLSLDAGAAYRADPTTKPGLAFVAQVWIEQEYLSGDFVQVGQELEQPAQLDGRCTFEVQELLEPYVEPLVPAVGQTTVLRLEGTFRRFLLKWFERTDVGDSAITSVDTNYLVHGGLGYVEAAASTWFTTFQPRQLPFLTWEPLVKKVLPDQPEYLYFMVHGTTTTQFRVRLRATFADGRQVEEFLATRTDVARYEIFSVPAGPVQLDVPAREAAAGQLLVRYLLDVVDEKGQLLSETRTYELDRRPCAVRRYFLYANSLGGWNTLVCRGRAAADLLIKTTASENARAAGYDPLRGDYTISRRTGLPVLHCYTGARSAAQLVADADFMLSERVLLLSEGRYQAGQVKDRTFTTYDEDETRRLVQFDYELPRERYHTPRLR